MTRVCRLVDPSVMMVGGGDGTNHVDTRGVCTPRAELSVSLSLPASTVARFPSLENTGFPLFGFFSFSSASSRLLWSPPVRPIPGFRCSPPFSFRASSSLPTLACSGVWFSCVVLQSPIRSRGRLPVGLGSLREFVNIRAGLSPTPLSLCLRPAALSRMDVIRTVKSKKRCPKG